jgi:membrane-bound ClpP family serine protease
LEHTLIFSVPAKMENPMNRKQIFILSLALLAAQIFTLTGLAQSENPDVLVLTADGPLTPAMVEYLRRGIRTAVQHTWWEYRPDE